MDDAMRKWETEISTKEEGLQEIYRKYLQKFLERWYLTPEELIELRKQNLRSDDFQDHRLVEDMVKTQMTEMIESGESPYTSRHIWKSVDSFLDTQGLELDIRAEDLPRGEHDNQLALPKEVRERIERSRRDWIIPY
jgi:hypothetical protein